MGGRRNRILYFVNEGWMGLCWFLIFHHSCVHQVSDLLLKQMMMSEYYSSESVNKLWRLPRFCHKLERYETDLNLMGKDIYSPLP